VFISLGSRYIFIYLINDVRTFTYKLTPVIHDDELAAMLRLHKESKGDEICKYREFEEKHARKFQGLEFGLLRDPRLLSPLPDDQNLLRLYAKKVKKAIDILYVQKDRITDARHSLRRRNGYILNSRTTPTDTKVQALIKYYEQDIETLREVNAFILSHELNGKELANLTWLGDALGSGDLGMIATRCNDFLPECDDLINILKKTIRKLKKLHSRVKKKITFRRFPAGARRVHNNIRRKADYNFFLNRWMVNHFILENHDLSSIHDIRNGKSLNCGTIPRGGEYRFLYNKLRRGFSSTTKTVRILHDTLGTPLHLEDRSIRNAMVLASNILKSQEKRMILMNCIHQYFKNRPDEVNEFLKDKRLPEKLRDDLSGEKYFFIDNILREYANNLSSFLKILQAGTISSCTREEMRSHFERVFERLWHHALNVILALPISCRTASTAQDCKRLFTFTMEHVGISHDTVQLLSDELDAINFERFITSVRFHSFNSTEKNEFIKFLRWCLTASFVQYKALGQVNDEEDAVEISRETLETFERHSFLSDAPLMSKDVVLMHGDDSRRVIDMEWGVPKISGNISEITNFNACTSDTLRCRWKMIQQDGTWKFEEFYPSP